MKKDYELPLDTLRFVQILGKNPSETRIRLIPNLNSLGRGVAKDCLNAATLEKWGRQRAGIYVVINDGGDDDESITQCRALFIEHDDLSIEQQASCWQGVLPKPTMQIYTGGDSLHQYWVFEKPIASQQWKELTRKAIKAFRSDPNNCNPSRLMRLPGYTYWNRKGETGPAASFYSCSEIKYSVEELENALSSVQLVSNAGSSLTTRNSHNGEWFAVKPCPICGRDLDDKCRMRIDEAFIQCHLGDTFAPPDGKRGQILKGHDGQRWQRKHRTSNVYGEAVCFALEEDNTSKIVKTKTDLINFIDNEYGDQLAWNELKRRLEMNNVPIKDINLMHCSLAERHGIHHQSNTVVDAFLYVGKKASFDPVTKFLSQAETAEPICELDEIGAKYLGLKTSIESRAFGVHLLAAAYRAFHPGYPYDQILIMRGKQGVGKTRTIKALAGSPEHYISTSVLTNEKDFLIQLGSCWHCEFEEIDGHIDSRHEAHLKALISRHTDNYRAPYAVSNEDQPRRSIFWGTTNQDKLLVDSTGNRRMMIIDLREEVDLDRLQRDLLPIWAVVMQAYRAGIKPLLTTDEIAEVAKIAAESYKEDPWLSVIDASIEGMPVVFEHHIQRCVLNIDVRNLKGGRSGEARRIHDCLRQLGYRKYDHQINGLNTLNKGWGKRTRGAWFASGIEPTSNGQEIFKLLKDAGKTLPTGPAYKMLDSNGDAPF